MQAYHRAHQSCSLGTRSELCRSSLTRQRGPCEHATKQLIRTATWLHTQRSRLGSHVAPARCWRPGEAGAPRRSGSAPGRLQATSTETADSQEDDSAAPFVPALLLAFFAAQGRSLFAARCVVEALLAVHAAGLGPGRVEVALALARLQSGGALLAPLEQELLASWAAMVLATLHQLGVPTANDQAPASPADNTPQAQGVQRFVAQVIEQFRGGMDTRRLLLQQRMALSASRGERLSPMVQVMQQNTRLIVLTLEAVRAAGLATREPLGPPPGAPPAPESVLAEGPILDDPEASISTMELLQQPGADTYTATATPAAQASGAASASTDDAAVIADQPGDDPDRQPGYVYSFLPQYGQTEQYGDSAQLELRSAAVRLLIAYMGAAHGSLYSLNAFVDHALSCYRRGWAAGQLCAQLRASEFEQAGGLVPLGTTASQEQQLSAELFALWVSTVFMTAAELGEPHAARQPGWAWAGGPATGLDAYRVAELVAAALRRQEGLSEGPAVAPPDVQAALARAQAQAPGGQEEQQRPPAPGLQEQAQAVLVRVEDEGVAATSPSVAVFGQQLSLVHLTRDRIRASQQPPRVDSRT